MKNNGLKNAKAITLIAMVVTIIVLLILAGVSIAVLTGENGILNRATSAKQTHEEKTEEEKLKLGVLALSTEYRSQTTHTADEDKFSKFVNKEANKTKLANELGVATSTIDIDETKDILTYRNKKYKLDSIGGITEYKPSIGDEITISDEHFYVIKKEGATITLLSKYNLATSTNSLGKYCQQNANHNITAAKFSNTEYWSTQKEEGKENRRININNWEKNYNNGNVAEGETLENNAILRARKYAIDVFGENVGAEGRLLTYEEASTNSDNTECLFGLGKVSTVVLYGTWVDEFERVGGSSGDGSLGFWLASSYQGASAVWDKSWDHNWFGGSSWEASNGVRPVIEVPESAIQ